jgi:pilus assembly protein CpaB
MNNKAFTISLVLASLAVFMIYSYISSKEQEYKTKYGSETAVVVAKQDISELGEIYANMVEIVSKPKQFVDPLRTTSKEEVVGFIATVPLKKGEQITLNKIAAPGVKTGLSRQVTPGKRAISISVSDENAVGRLIKPGDRIDVVATIEAPGAQKGNQISKIVLQDVPVLAVGEWITTQAPRKVEKDDMTGKDSVRRLNIERNFNTIAVEVDPNAAVQVMLLRRTGVGMDIMLRNNDDTERVVLGGVNIVDVLGQDASRVMRAPAAQR